MKNNPHCLFESDFETFLKSDTDAILGKLNNNYHGNLLTTTRDSWKEEVEVMKNTLSNFQNEEGTIIFEYDIPRLPKRIDVVLLFKGIIFCIEFKTGKEKDENNLEVYIDQVLDYALDLKNFHKYSQNSVIVPILVVNANTVFPDIDQTLYDDKVVSPLITRGIELYKIINKMLKKFPNENKINSDWSISPYTPTPTIIEAARKLYENHTVEDIKKHEAETENTIKYILGYYS